MNGARLWPLLLGLALLLSGAMVVETAARESEGRVLHIQISRSHTSLDGDENDDEVDAEVWYENDPLDVDHQAARRLARRGSYEESFERFEALVQRHPENGMLWAEYGHWLRKGQQPTRAADALGRALEALPDSPGLHLDLALLAKANGEFAAAEREFETALAMRAGHMPTRVAYARMLRRQGKLDRAIEIIRPATQAGSNERRARALATLGQIYGEAGDFVEARQAFSESVERAPAAASLWAKAALTLCEADDPETTAEGLRYAQAAVRLAPDSPFAHKALARAYSRNELPNDAFAAYRKVVQLDGNDRSARKRVLRYALDLENYALARKQAQALLELDENSAEHHFLAAFVESKAGNPERARASYRNAVERAEQPYPEAWFNLGLLERKLGNPDEALTAYSEAIRLRPDYEAAINNRGLVYEDLGRLDDAEQQFRLAIEQDEQYSSAWANLGRVLAAQRRYPEASAALRVASELDPESRSTRLKLGVTLRKSGQPNEAIAVYETLLQAHPRYVKAWYNLALALDSADRSDEAKAAYETALGYDRNHWRSLKNLGLLEVRRGETDAAEQHLLGALEMRPADGESLLELARVEYERSDLDGCVTYAGRVLSVKPDSADARQLLDRCRTKQ